MFNCNIIKKNTRPSYLKNQLYLDLLNLNWYTKKKEMNWKNKKPKKTNTGPDSK